MKSFPAISHANEKVVLATGEGHRNRHATNTNEATRDGLAEVRSNVFEVGCRVVMTGSGEHRCLLREKTRHLLIPDDVDVRKDEVATRGGI